MLIKRLLTSRAHTNLHTHTSSQRQEAGQEAPICAPIVLSSRRLAAESGVPIELSLSSYLWLVWWSFIVLFCTVISYFLSTFFFLSEATLTPEAHHYQCYDVYRHTLQYLVRIGYVQHDLSIVAVKIELKRQACWGVVAWHSPPVMHWTCSVAHSCD